MSVTDDAMLEIDVVVESECWSAVPEAEPTLRRAIAAAAAALSTTQGELAIVLSDDSTVRGLNRDWRGIDAATNVLSFPAHERPADPAAARTRRRRPPRLLGDIVLAYETLAREAQKQRKPFAHHLAHLGVHGFLHLLGYDHERDEDADVMERIERDILARLAIPDPYRHAAGAR
jgi:probable rRNA maturation factor